MRGALGRYSPHMSNVNRSAMELIDATAFTEPVPRWLDDWLNRRKALCEHTRVYPIMPAI